MTAGRDRHFYYIVYAMNKTKSEIATIETYPPEVQKQINNFLLYRNGKQMVKRYLAILSSPDYLERSDNYCRISNRKKNARL